MTNTESGSSAAKSMAGRIGALTRWAMAADPHAELAPAREGFRSKFERMVDPDGTLDPGERAIRAQRARTAYMTKLALKSAAVRRLRKSGGK